MDIAVPQPGAAGSNKQRSHHRPTAAALACLLLLTLAGPASAEPPSAEPPTVPPPREAPAGDQPQRFRTTERFALRLINCLRTGGKVTPAGACIGYGSGRYSKSIEPLALSAKISNKVAWPYAGRVATAGRCEHDLGGTTTDTRFRTVGLRHIDNGENLACRWVSGPRQMVVYWVRHWYREAAYGGAHWRQIKDPDFRTVGLGVARHASGRMSLVVDFYGQPVP